MKKILFLFTFLLVLIASKNVNAHVVQIGYCVKL
jgi:hypothetical protein